MIIARPFDELNPLCMEGVVVAIDDEGLMVEVRDTVRGKTYHLFTPYGMMPPVLREQVKVGLPVHVESWHEPEMAGRMFMSMSAVVKKERRNADTSREQG